MSLGRGKCTSVQYTAMFSDSPLLFPATVHVIISHMVTGLLILSKPYKASQPRDGKQKGQGLLIFEPVNIAPSPLLTGHICSTSKKSKLRLKLFFVIHSASLE